jgi:hypothetical protein
MSTPLRWNRDKTFWQFLINGVIRRYCGEIVVMLRFAPANSRFVGKPHLTIWETSRRGILPTLTISECSRVMNSSHVETLRFQIAREIGRDFVLTIAR